MMMTFNYPEQELLYINHISQIVHYPPPPPPPRDTGILLDNISKLSILVTLPFQLFLTKIKDISFYASNY